MWIPLFQSGPCVAATQDMLKTILNRLKPQAEIIAEEQACFWAERSTTEQIFNLWILCEKYLQHQQDLYHVFIDFEKAFDRVWHAALQATMKKCNINTNLIRVIKNLYGNMSDSLNEYWNVNKQAVVLTTYMLD